MKAEYLRIGNLALRKGRGAWDKHFNETVVDHNDIVTCVSNPNIFKPIPLTEEWLQRLGARGSNKHRAVFYKFQTRESSIKTLVVKAWHESTGYSTISEGGTFTHGKVQIKCVHQLQNLYHALTGEELTLTQ